MIKYLVVILKMKINIFRAQYTKIINYYKICWFYKMLRSKFDDIVYKPTIKIHFFIKFNIVIKFI
jgi:hypothetical protein